MQLLLDLFLLIVLLLHSKGVVGGPTIDATIDRAFNVGIDEFLAYQNEPITVSCEADQTLASNGTIEIFQDNTRIKTGPNNDAVTSVALPVIDLGINYERRINVTCRLHVRKSQLIGEERGSYEVNHTVGLTLRRYTPDLRFCFSSIGRSATPTETSKLYCGRSPPASNVDYFHLKWSNQDAQRFNRTTGTLFFYFHQRINVSMFTTPMTCYSVFPDDQLTTEVCRLPELEIISNPTVSISPVSFPESVESMSFSCQSNPPSRIRWVILRDHGDILDLGFYRSFLPDEELSISISVMGGSSTLALSGSGVRALKIHTVQCIAGKRTYYRSAVAQPGAFHFTAHPDEGTVATPCGVDCDGTSGNKNTIYIIVVIISSSVIVLLLAVTYMSKRKSQTSNSNGDNIQQHTLKSEPDSVPVSASGPYTDLKFTNSYSTRIYQSKMIADAEYEMPAF